MDLLIIAIFDTKTTAITSQDFIVFFSRVQPGGTGTNMLHILLLANSNISYIERENDYAEIKHKQMLHLRSLVSRYLTT